MVCLRLVGAFAKCQTSGSKATLLPPCPLRTRRASFPAARSSLSNALIGTRLAAFTILAWSRRTFRVGGCTNGIFRYHLLFPLSRFARFSREERPEGSLPAFAWSNFAKGSTPIHSITERHSLFSLVLYPHRYQLALRLVFP